MKLMLHATNALALKYSKNCVGGGAKDELGAILAFIRF